MLNFQHQNLNLQQQPQAQTASPQALRDPATPINQAVRNPRKRKTPPADPAPPPPPPQTQQHQQQQQQQQQPQQQQPQQLQHVLPPPHSMMHPLAAPGAMPAYQYDYSPGGMQPQPNAPQDPNMSAGSPASARPLSNSKRAEQNRKAQRAFRERRDQCVPVSSPIAKH